ncbi:hypothetical protein RI367_000979 [Sorochytrium milnesiophthora]
MTLLLLLLHRRLLRLTATITTTTATATATTTAKRAATLLLSSRSMAAQTNTSYTADRYNELVSNLRDVQSAISRVLASDKREVTLVAVSKTKPASDIQALYDAGHRHFGENYVQELVDKAQALPKDIRWHFIGHLQSNKVKLLTSVSSLHMVETVDSAKLADTLNKHWGGDHGLRVLVQINTSGEASKSGVASGAEAAALAQHIVSRCPRLQFCGLMTIGAVAEPEHGERRQDFEALAAAAREVVQSTMPSSPPLELSMGMSGDYPDAIRHGSSNVRVGSVLFGARERK